MEYNFLAHPERNRDLWLELKSKHITGTDASKILEVSNYGTKLDVWLDKTGRAEEVEPTEAMILGTLLEPVVKTMFTLKYPDLELEDSPGLVRHVSHPLLACTPDGLVFDGNDTFVFEAKVSANPIWEAGEIPNDALAQCAHNPLTINAKGTHLACLYQGKKLITHFVERNGEFEEFMLNTYSEFWKHVVEDVPPPFRPTNESVKQLYKISRSNEIELSAEWEERIAHMLDMKEHVKRFEAEIEQIEAELKNQMGENERARCGTAALSWKSINSNRLDTTALKAAHPELVAQFMKSSSYRRFTAKMEA